MNTLYKYKEEICLKIWEAIYIPRFLNNYIIVPTWHLRSTNTKPLHEDNFKFYNYVWLVLQSILDKETILTPTSSLTSTYTRTLTYTLGGADTKVGKWGAFPPVFVDSCRKLQF